jgi:hypothetical protein
MASPAEWTWWVSLSSAVVFGASGAAAAASSAAVASAIACDHRGLHVWLPVAVDGMVADGAGLCGQHGCRLESPASSCRVHVRFMLVCQGSVMYPRRVFP